MKRLSLILTTGALICGCAGGPLSYFDVSEREAQVEPGISPVTSLLLSASETEWRKVIDTGDLEFDDVGMPLMDSHDAKMKEYKARRFGIRVGPIAEVNLDAYPSSVENVQEDGPLGGVFVSLGPRTWWFAIELGVDIASVRGEYYDPSPDMYSNNMPGNFKSTLIMSRFDAVVYFANPLKTPRIYIVNGYRQADESTEIWFGDRSQTYDNSSSGWCLALGMKFGRFDLRIDQVFLADDEFQMTAFTAAYRF